MLWLEFLIKNHINLLHGNRSAARLQDGRVALVDQPRPLILKRRSSWSTGITAAGRSKYCFMCSRMVAGWRLWNWEAWPNWNWPWRSIWWCLGLGIWHDWLAKLFFAKTEWTGAYILNKRKPPTVREIVRLIEQLGGFLVRKGDGEPWGSASRLCITSSVGLRFREGTFMIFDFLIKIN